ncbi:MAG: hypothetical protein HY670_02795 [Chloroflexi bacterium]|nr:hypothetical protein [Chloroflexota bacterium]
MTPEEEIKQLAIQRGAEKVGIASVAEINKYAPVGHRPDDILPGAKSVVVFVGRDALRGVWRSPNFQTHYHNREFGRVRGGVGMAVAKLIESKYGHYAVTDYPAGIGHYPPLSMKLCAELAGLGTRSMAGAVILNKELGLLNIGACTTTMPLAADGRMSEAVCPHPACVQLWAKKKTTPCLEACPECLSGELEDGQIKWLRYDRRICSTRAQSMGWVELQRTMLRVADEPDPAMRRNMLFGSFARNMVETIATGNVVGQCGECLRYCPVCIEARGLKVKEVVA